jgi:hypothetical protein
MNVAKGTWVEIESIVLKPEERAPGLPEDTAKTPYVLRLSAFSRRRPRSGRRSR